MTTSGPLGLAGAAPVATPGPRGLAGAAPARGLAGPPPSSRRERAGAAGPPASRLMRWASPVAGLALLAWTARRVEFGPAAARLAAASPLWLALAFAASALPLLLSAWRWRYTAGRLGLGIPWGWAWREYYVATLLNQVLPGGVLGDVARALRHRSSLGAAFEAQRGASAKAVVFERASNQFVVWAWAAALAPLWAGGGAKAWAGWPFVAAALPLLGGAWWLSRGRLGAAGAWAGRAARSALVDGRQVFFRGGAGLVHLGASALIFALFGAVFWCASAAVGVPLDTGRALRIIPLVLVASSLPLTPSGWGVREAAAAALYGAEGLPPVVGATASVLYGLVSLAATLPGAIFLAFPHRQRPGCPAP